MIEPQGPLPPEIYWRRRAVAIGGAVLLVVVVVALIIWTTSGGSDDNTKNAASGSSLTASTPATPSVEPSESAGPDEGGGNGTGNGNGNPPPPGQSSAAQSSTPPPGPPPPGGAHVALCQDQSISVVLYTDKPTYTTGQKPVFTIVTTNAGLTECTRDVGKSAQNVIVRTLDGTRTLWSARDCSPLNTVNNVVLKPAQQVKDTINWSGTTSSPGCDKPRTQIPVGSYSAIGKIGERESFPITFNVVAPAQQP